MEIKYIDTLSTWNESGERWTGDYALNISERHKVFLWLWNKTGTTHMSQVLKFFGFHAYRFNDGVKSFHAENIVQQHTCKLFPGHENYKLLVSARNPYSRFASHFRAKIKPELPTKDGFQNFVEDEFGHVGNCFECSSFHVRKPDYFVRVEFMYEDYCRIPFIQNTDLLKSGNLKKLCEKKVNENPYKSDWRDCYTESSADLVYYNTQEYFKFFGYDKNSWKK